MVEAVPIMCFANIIKLVIVARVMAGIQVTQGKSNTTTNIAIYLIYVDFVVYLCKIVIEFKLPNEEIHVCKPCICMRDSVLGLISH